MRRQLIPYAGQEDAVHLDRHRVPVALARRLRDDGHTWQGVVDELRQLTGHAFTLDGVVRAVRRAALR